MKKLLYFSDSRIVAYEWQKDQFISRKTFEQTEEDKDQFILFLQEHKKAPIRILVDIIEEGFKRDKVPYVIGTDRKALFERTTKKNFRANKYTYIETQGRDKEGRKDLRVLISGLLNPENFEYWIDILKEYEAPIEGIYSLPIVGELITKKLKSNDDNILVITQQGPYTLRQNYYVKGQLVQSRLSSINDEKGIKLIRLLEKEIIKTRHFLNSTRVYKTQEKLNILIIVSDQSKVSSKDQDLINHTLLSLSEAFSKLQIKSKPISPYADILFAYLLLEKPFYRNHYAPTALRSGYFHLLISKALKYASAFLFFIFLFYSINFLLSWYDQEQSIYETEQGIKNYQNEISRKQKELETYKYSATMTKEVVNLFDQLKAYTNTSPRYVFETISKALKNNPNIVLEDISFQVSNKISDNLTDISNSSSNPTLSFDDKKYSIITLKGKIISFATNYRLAIQYYRDFLSSLESMKNVVKVKDILSPFNLNSNSEIIGDSGTFAEINRKTNASFKLILAIGERDAKL